MAELPEIRKLSGQMNDELSGRIIKKIDLLQEKCSNVPECDLNARVAGASVAKVYNRGKWIFTEFSNGENILLSLGMGADALYYGEGGRLPDKYQINLLLTDGGGYTVRFWWFGKYLLAANSELDAEPNTKDIAIDAFDPLFTLEYFAKLLSGKKTGVKAFLMNQRNVGGIGNMYMHDILFKARLHPQRKISDMTPDDVDNLYDSIKEIFKISVDAGTFMYENDFYGQKGSYGMDHFLVGYKEGKPCPVCGEPIVQLRVGGSPSFICPVCQKI